MTLLGAFRTFPSKPEGQIKHFQYSYRFLSILMMFRKNKSDISVYRNFFFLITFKLYRGD